MLLLSVPVLMVLVIVEVSIKTTRVGLEHSTRTSTMRVTAITRFDVEDAE